MAFSFYPVNSLKEIHAFGNQHDQEKATAQNKIDDAAPQVSVAT